MPKIQTITIKKLRDIIEARKERSAWNKGVQLYALDLLNNLAEQGYTKLNELATPDGKTITAAMLNGAADWNAYSWGGCALIYNTDIAKRLCTASELKRTKNGERRPNSREEWLDVQARALYQAAQLICIDIRFNTYKE